MGRTLATEIIPITPCCRAEQRTWPRAATMSIKRQMVHINHKPTKLQWLYSHTFAHNVNWYAILAGDSLLCIDAHHIRFSDTDRMITLVPFVDLAN